MSTTRQIAVPRILDLHASLAFAAELAALDPNVTVLGIDFSAWGQVEAYKLPLRPFGMLVVSQAIQQCKSRNPAVVIAPTNLPGNDIESYAAHMGFFDACGMNVEKPYGDARGGQTYLPMTRVKDPGLLHGSDIEKLSLSLAQQLTQQQDGALVKTLQYSFTEIIRNVAEHAQSPDYWYCAQYWPSRGEAEIALIDSGRGLRASLRNNPIIREQVVDDRAAVKFALMPGISGAMWQGKPQRADDVWQNSGFGLYMNYRICAEGGNFFIASGDTGLFCEKDAEHQYTSYHLPGVALRLRMRAETLEQYEQRYHHIFLADGEREASKIKGGVLPTGERMSRMLRTSFSDTKE
ncbi:MAG: hypothetical protein SNJ54_00060 [Anaerolineae bacterium]